LTLRRVRRLTLEELAPYLLSPSTDPGPLDWQQVFGNANPVEVEVGFGKGLFLVKTAPVHPEVNFVGIEIARKYQLFTATRLAKRQLHNVRLAKADARQLFRDHIADASCQAVHIYFPDPWWKKRHLKRRVFTADFAAQCARVLIPGGQLHLATDVEEYFQVMMDLVGRETQLRSLPATAAGGDSYITNFERKSKERGRQIFRADYVKEPGNPAG
jgi:tRNA (guanine-N7-)-methyltransferase